MPSKYAAPPPGPKRPERPAIEALRKLLHAKAKGPKIPTLVDALSEKRK